MRYRVLCFSLLTFFLAVADGRFLAAEPAEDAPSVQTAPVIGQAASAGSQPTKGADGAYTLKSSTQLVVLDVIVRDPQGNVVTGLTKDDFKVTEAKQPQTILNFDPAGAHMVSPEITIHSTQELDRLAPDAPVNIILLDEFNTRYEDMSQARFYLKQYLESQPERLATPTMLVAADITDSETWHRLKVISDYTQDRQTLLNALKHYFPHYPFASESMGHSLTGNRLSERGELAFQTLDRVAEATQGHKGHKNLIWVGNGFPEKIDCNPIPWQVWDALDQSEKKMREARVTLYAMPPGLLGKEEPFLCPVLMMNMAEDTGGTRYSYNDKDVGIDKDAREAAAFYTLSYRPTTESMAEQKFRQIVVTVNQPGLIAKTSTGYYGQTEQDYINSRHPKLAQGERSFAMLSADSTLMVYDAVPVTVAQAPDDKNSFTVHVDARGVVWTPATDTERRQAHVILLASTFDKNGKELKRVAKDVDVSSPPDMPQTGEVQRGLAVPVKVELDPKATRVRFVVRENATGRIGTADYNLHP